MELFSAREGKFIGEMLNRLLYAVIEVRVDNDKTSLLIYAAQCYAADKLKEQEGASNVETQKNR